MRNVFRWSQENRATVEDCAGLLWIYSEFSLPYAPFKEILKHILLIDESEGEKKTKSEKIFNFTLMKALEIAPDLISTFVPGDSIIAKVGEGLISEMGLLDKFKTSA